MKYEFGLFDVRRKSVSIRAKALVSINRRR